MAASRAADVSAKSYGGASANDGSLLTHPKQPQRVHRPVVRESDMRKFATQARHLHLLLVHNLLLVLMRVGMSKKVKCIV